MKSKHSQRLMTNSQLDEKLEFFISFVKEAQLLRLIQQEYAATLNPILLPELQAKERHFDQLITMFVHHHLMDISHHFLAQNFSQNVVDAAENDLNSKNKN